MCDLTCTWTKRLVTWLVFGPNDLWLDLTWHLTKWLVTWLGLARKWLVTWLGLARKWLVTWLGLARKWLVTWLGLARKWLVTWLGLAKNDLLPSLIITSLTGGVEQKSGGPSKLYNLSLHCPFTRALNISWLGSMNLSEIRPTPKNTEEIPRNESRRHYTDAQLWCSTGAVMATGIHAGYSKG